MIFIDYSLRIRVVGLLNSNKTQATIVQRMNV